MKDERGELDNANEKSSDGVSRRDVMKTGMIAGGAAALGAASVPLFAPAAMAEVGLGPPRKIIWVTHQIGEWNIALETGFTDFGEKAGWTFQKIGVPGGAWSAEENVNRVKQAIQIKPDVIVAPILDLAMEPVLEEAEEAGILVLVNNTIIEEVQARHVHWGYVGATGHAQGLIIGRTLIPDLIKKGRKGGVLSFGNHAPASPFLVARREGVADAAAEANEREGTNFVVEEFLDHADDMAQSVPLYSTKMRGLGDDLAAFTPSGYQSMVAAYRMLEDAGRAPGEVPVAGPDTGPDIIEGIEKGYISFAVDQELYNQGYLPGPVAWARLERGNLPPIMNTGTAVVTKDNLDLFSWRSEIILARAKELGIRL